MRSSQVKARIQLNKDKRAIRYALNKYQRTARAGQVPKKYYIINALMVQIEPTPGLTPDDWTVTVSDAVGIYGLYPSEIEPEMLHWRDSSSITETQCASSA